MQAQPDAPHARKISPSKRWHTLESSHHCYNETYRGRSMPRTHATRAPSGNSFAIRDHSFLRYLPHSYRKDRPPPTPLARNTEYYEWNTSGENSWFDVRSFLETLEAPGIRPGMGKPSISEHHAVIHRSVFLLPEIIPSGRKPGALRSAPQNSLSLIVSRVIDPAVPAR